MQIFRVSPNHEVSAKYLDNRRLSKQILELYQIIRVCLAHMELIEGNTKYIHHPIVQHVYNDGNPYIIDTFQLLKEMNKEHIRRGGKRSESFKQDLSNLALIIDKNRSHFLMKTYLLFTSTVMIKYTETQLTKNILNYYIINGKMTRYRQDATV